MFAKHWCPGAVKTRLAQSIGKDRASQVYREFVITLLDRLQHAADRRTVVFSPAERRAEFAEITPATWELAEQTPGDLGQRMHAFFASFLRRREDRVVLIGTDSPTIPKESIDAAFDALQTYSVVLGPSRDGGYYLVGAKGDVPPIFSGIQWSSPSVWQQTVERLNEAGRPFAELPLWYDVDTVSDLEQLDHELQQLARDDSAWTCCAAAVQAALTGRT